MQKIPYRSDIDGLRGIAVLFVIFYHAFPSLLPGGFVGVDIFFVISGFLITTIIIKDLKDGTFSFVDFYVRRIRRLFPSLIVVIATVLSMGWFLLLPLDYESVAKHALVSTFFSVNFIFGAELNYFDHDIFVKPLVHLWSLSIEEQFYIIWPIVIILLRRPNFLLPIVAIGFFCSLLFNISFIFENQTKIFYSPFARFWELMAGCIIAIISTRVKASFLFAPLGLICTLSAVVAFNNTLVYPGFYALLPVIGATLLIVAGNNNVINKKVLSWRPLVWVGLISYPLYLWHWPLLAFARIEEGQEPVAQIRLIILAVSFLLAWGCYVFLEKPIRQKSHSPLVFGVLVLLMLGVGGASFVVYKNNGFSSRIPEEIRVLATKIDFRWHDTNPADYGGCYLGGRADRDRPDGCFQPYEPDIFLWGDSHAISLYPGIKSLQESYNFSFIALTQSSCPPLINIPVLNYRLNCNEINQSVFKSLVHLKPRVILLYSSWEHMGDFPMSRDVLLQKLEETISGIRKTAPSAKVIVMGPTPRWTNGLQRVMYENYKALGHLQSEEYMSFGLDITIGPLDYIMQKKVQSLGVTYISAYQHLCNERGCLTRVGPKPTDLTLIDYGHLSIAGAKYLAESLKEELLADLKQ